MSRPVFFFDLDNTLYSSSLGVAQMMGERIQAYFANNLHLPADEAQKLHSFYYRHYGLALRGLVRHHKVNAMDYNAQVDAALPLDDLLKPNPQLRELLLRIDRSKCKLWIFTNAYITHAERVLRLLDLEGIFEGITYCDYNDPHMACKPYAEFYHQVMRDAGLDPARDAYRCLFVDDSKSNVDGAVRVGWRHVLFYDEGDDKKVEGGVGAPVSRAGVHEQSFPAPHKPAHAQMKPEDYSPACLPTDDNAQEPVKEMLALDDPTSASAAAAQSRSESTNGGVRPLNGGTRANDAGKGYSTIDDLRQIEKLFPDLFLEKAQAALA
ncbi:Putative suppressor of disruption of TFIIS [Savitreella phatthalungensis]